MEPAELARNDDILLTISRDSASESDAYPAHLEDAIDLRQIFKHDLAGGIGDLDADEAADRVHNNHIYIAMVGQRIIFKRHNPGQSPGLRTEADDAVGSERRIRRDILRQHKELERVAVCLWRQLQEREPVGVKGAVLGVLEVGELVVDAAVDVAGIRAVHIPMMQVNKKGKNWAKRGTKKRNVAQKERKKRKLCQK